MKLVCSFLECLRIVIHLIHPRFHTVNSKDLKMGALAQPKTSTKKAGSEAPSRSGASSDTKSIARYKLVIFLNI